MFQVSKFGQPRNYTRAGLTVIATLKGLSFTWRYDWEVSAHVDWWPAPEVCSRLNKAYGQRKNYTEATTKVRIVRSRLHTREFRQKYTEQRKHNGKTQYRITEYGKAHLANLEDQARRKHTAKGGTRRNSNRRVQGSVPGESTDAALGGDV